MIAQPMASERSRTSAIRWAECSGNSVRRDAISSDPHGGENDQADDGNDRPKPQRLQRQARTGQQPRGDEADHQRQGNGHHARKESAPCAAVARLREPPVDQDKYAGDKRDNQHNLEEQQEERGSSGCKRGRRVSNSTGSRSRRQAGKQAGDETVGDLFECPNQRSNVRFRCCLVAHNSSPFDCRDTAPSGRGTNRPRSALPTNRFVCRRQYTLSPRRARRGSSLAILVPGSRSPGLRNRRCLAASWCILLLDQKVRVRSSVQPMSAPTLASSSAPTVTPLIGVMLA